MSPMGQHWDIFCRVIDNYGDIGVCWRLARQLANEFGLKVRLWVDAPESLARLVPEAETSRPQQWVDQVEIRHWPSDNFPETEAADVVIEAFACDIPPSYLAAMAKHHHPPHWINLEYLTAEPWAENCHGGLSPHPFLPLKKVFYFPGFSARTGGLLREADLLQRRGKNQRSKAGSEIQISIFCYSDAPITELLAAMAKSATPIHCGLFGALAEGTLPPVWSTDHSPYGSLRMSALPFVPQADFDQQLWQNDLNFVRGEDSFVRAQWAAKPFVWNIYPQEDNAHKVKLDAFLDLYCAKLPAETARATRAMFHAWNGFGEITEAWPAFQQQLPALTAHARQWAAHLAQQTDLATNLVNFCASTV